MDSDIVRLQSLVHRYDVRIERCNDWNSNLVRSSVWLCILQTRSTHKYRIIIQIIANRQPNHHSNQTIWFEYRLYLLRLYTYDEKYFTNQIIKSDDNSRMTVSDSTFNYSYVFLRFIFFAYSSSCKMDNSDSFFSTEFFRIWCAWFPMVLSSFDL